MKILLLFVALILTSCSFKYQQPCREVIEVKIVSLQEVRDICCKLILCQDTDTVLGCADVANNKIVVVGDLSWINHEIKHVLDTKCDSSCEDLICLE